MLTLKYNLISGETVLLRSLFMIHHRGGSELFLLSLQSSQLKVKYFPTKITGVKNCTNQIGLTLNNDRREFYIKQSVSPPSSARSKKFSDMLILSFGCAWCTPWWRLMSDCNRIFAYNRYLECRWHNMLSYRQRCDNNNIKKIRENMISA
jgi:hypothetical protein